MKFSIFKSLCVSALAFGFLGCAHHHHDAASADVAAPAAMATPAVATAAKEIVHNDDEVRAKISTLCPFTLVEMEHGRSSLLNCNGSIGKKSGKWTVKDNELILSGLAPGGEARYTIDVMKAELYIDGVTVVKKNGKYKIDAPD